MTQEKSGSIVECNLEHWFLNHQYLFKANKCFYTDRGLDNQIISLQYSAKISHKYCDPNNNTLNDKLICMAALSYN